MKLYDEIIKETKKILSGKGLKRYPYNPDRIWPTGDEGELIMLKDSAFELGGSGRPSLNFTCVTTQDSVWKFKDGSETLVLGKDLREIKSDVPFARIVVLETEDLGEEDDTEKAYQAIKSLEFVRYHIFPKGYMIRVSAQSQQEQVRVSKRAVQRGISFPKIGNVYINRYSEIPLVKAVRVIFVTEKDVVEELMPYAKKVDEITSTLTHILDGLPTDCGHCDMKPVCDEVEGMRELHLGKKG